MRKESFSSSIEWVFCRALCSLRSEAMFHSRADAQKKISVINHIEIMKTWWFREGCGIGNDGKKNDEIKRKVPILAKSLQSFLFLSLDKLKTTKKTKRKCFDYLMDC